MKTFNHHFFMDMGVMFGRSIRHILRSRAPLLIMPLALLLLFILIMLVALIGIFTHPKP